METINSLSKGPVNRVALSGLLTLDPESLRPKNKLKEYDLRQNLYLDQVIREKDFRLALLNFDWATYNGFSVALFCSVEAIIPLWAYMLVATYLQPYTVELVQGNLEDLEKALWHKAIENLDLTAYINKRVVIKGCGEHPIPISVYVELIGKLKPHVKSLLFGEPCSTVPLYKASIKEIQ